MEKSWQDMDVSKTSPHTWRMIIPVSKWLVTKIYKPFWPFRRGTTPVRGLSGVILQVHSIFSLLKKCMTVCKTDIQRPHIQLQGTMRAMGFSTSAWSWPFSSYLAILVFQDVVSTMETGRKYYMYTHTYIYIYIHTCNTLYIYIESTCLS